LRLFLVLMGMLAPMSLLPMAMSMPVSMPVLGFLMLLPGLLVFRPLVPGQTKEAVLRCYEPLSHAIEIKRIGHHVDHQVMDVVRQRSCEIENDLFLNTLTGRNAGFHHFSIGLNAKASAMVKMTEEREVHCAVGAVTNDNPLAMRGGYRSPGWLQPDFNFLLAREVRNNSATGAHNHVPGRQLRSIVLIAPRIGLVAAVNTSRIMFL
jgi:hypothetical protein